MLANLRLIRDVAHAHSITKAAKLGEISQSAASQAIQEIERELGVTLFDRSTRPLTVTAAGKLYVEYCRDVLRRHEELEAGLQTIKKEASGKVRLAAIYSVGLSDMAAIEERFYQMFPQAELNISYLRPERVWEAVEDDQADLGLMSYAESSREVVALPWREEEMVVAVGPQHPLAGHEQIAAEALEGESFIGFDDDLPIQSQIERFLHEHRVNVEVVLRFDNLEMIKQAVAHGAGLSIMPERVLREDQRTGRLAAVRLQPAELFRPVRIVHRRRKVLSEAMTGLLGVLRGE
ncbi:MAG: LysR family transcriptional regulator [Acidobacteriaceae bacterium]|nr:LysR family transcriptional regulator [Acidobacteriaceae bacterium]